MKLHYVPSHSGLKPLTKVHLWIKMQIIHYIVINEHIEIPKTLTKACGFLCWLIYSRRVSPNWNGRYIIFRPTCYLLVGEKVFSSEDGKLSARQWHQTERKWRLFRFSAEGVLSFKFSVCVIERESKQNCFLEIIKKKEIKSKKIDVIIKWMDKK